MEYLVGNVAAELLSEQAEIWGLLSDRQFATMKGC